AELYDPRTNRWSPAGECPGVGDSLTAPQVTQLANGLVFVAYRQVSREMGSLQARTAAVIFDPATKIWRTVAVAPLPSPRWVRPVSSRCALVAGTLPYRVEGGGVMTVASSYDTEANEWSPVLRCGGEVSFNGTWTELSGGTLLACGGSDPLRLLRQLPPPVTSE